MTHAYNYDNCICIYTLPSPSGSGKTYAITREAHRLAQQGRRVLIVQPTIELIEKTQADEIKPLSPQVDCVAIHSGCSDNVLRDVQKRLKKDDEGRGDGGQITLITHAEFIKLQLIEGRDDIIVFIDEVPAAEKCLTHNLPETHHLLTGCIDVVAEGPIYGRVSVINEEGLKEIAKNKRKDDLWGNLFDTAWVLLSDAWKVHVNMEQYRKLQAGKGRQLTFFCTLRPEVFEGYKRVTIAGANLEDSILYHLFTQQSVSFGVDEKLAETLRYRSHENGPLVTIYYAFAGFWSKNKQSQKATANGDFTKLDEMVEAANKLFGDDQFLWMGNKSLTKSPFVTENAIRLPNMPHGLNQYSDVHNIVVLSAMNPSPAHFSFLRSREVTAEQVRMAIHMNNVYQAVLRSSIRSQSTDRKKIFVPDYDTACYLASLFPDCKLEQLNGHGLIEFKSKTPGRRKKYQSDAERITQHRKHVRAMKRKAINDIVTLKSYHGSPNADLELCNDITNITFISEFVSQHTVGTLYSGIRSYYPFGYVNQTSNEHFIECLASFHRNIIQSKDDNKLISPALFNPDKYPGKKRGIENIEYLRGIWLDFEEGDLRPNEFPDLFPDLCMVVCNTFRHTPEKPRFRISCQLRAK